MRLLVVSNRLPFTAVTEGGTLSFRESVGGLVSGLSSYLGSLKGSPFSQAQPIWIGWPGISIDESMHTEVRQQIFDQFNAWPVFLDEQVMEQFYHGFCNQTIWPLFHYFPSYAVYDEHAWQTYQEVNQLFCDEVMSLAQPGDLIWIHDYHLMLLPQMLRRQQLDLTIGFFLHIPFPTYEIYRLLPSGWRAQILEGLLGADLVGFHTHDDTQYFLRCVRRILELEAANEVVMFEDRMAKAGAFPISIDFTRFHRAIDQPPVQQEVQQLRQQIEPLKVILSVDRLDYSKGIINRLEGYQIFLEKYPDWHGKVMLILIVVPSRIGVEHYQRMRRQIDELVGRINGRLSTLNWTPVLYQYRYLPFDALSALYSVSDVALITPLRDGMNLVAKEYVATRVDQSGVLILSEMAGAAQELTDALIINPNHREEIAAALHTALTMPHEEQIERNRRMQARLRRYDVIKWADDFLRTSQNIHAQQAQYERTRCGPTTMEAIAAAYHRAPSRLLLLDYDGTLVPLSRHPEGVRPSTTVLARLNQLASTPGTKVVLFSGRDKAILESWFGTLPIGLIAEHGVWIKTSEAGWQMSQVLHTDWKTALLPLFEACLDRVPGSFLEEKEFGIAWHYRSADPDLSGVCAKQLVADLLTKAPQQGVTIIQGNKVIEVHALHSGNKTVMLQVLLSNVYDFILAIGDDTANEDLFRALPPEAYSITVGHPPSVARFHVATQQEVYQLLDRLMSTENRELRTEDKEQRTKN